MPAPLFWLGASTVAMLAAAKYSEEVNQQNQGYVGTFPGDGCHKVDPVDGAIMCCGVYQVFEHSGIWVDGSIVELKGNGLIRGVSPNRFLQNRSGEQIFVACDPHNRPLSAKGTASRAASRLFEYSEYDVIQNNCHKFVWQCISGEQSPLTGFSELNRLKASKFDHPIHWQPYLWN